MNIISTEDLSLSHRQEILKLWNREYPLNLMFEDREELDEFLSKLSDRQHTLLLDEQGRLKGWYADFIREGERWFVLLLHSDYHGRGFGTRLMRMAQQQRSELHGWVINTDEYRKADGQPYRSPTNFYRKLGFQVLEHVVLESEKIRVIKIYWAKARFATP